MFELKMTATRWQTIYTKNYTKEKILSILYHICVYDSAEYLVNTISSVY